MRFGLSVFPGGRVRPEGADRSLSRAPQPEDEEDVEPALEELEQREVLVLGLDGSGKSTFLRVLAGKPPLEGHIPTWGFNSVRLPTRNFEVDLLESEQTPPHPHPHPRARLPHHLSWTQVGACYLSRTRPCGKSFPCVPGVQDGVQHCSVLWFGRRLSLDLSAAHVPNPDRLTAKVSCMPST